MAKRMTEDSTINRHALARAREDVRDGSGHRRDAQRFIVRPGPLGAPGPPNGDGNGGGGNTLDARETSSMRDLRNTHSKGMTDSNTRGDNIRIRNRDSRSKGPAQSRFPQFREVR